MCQNCCCLPLHFTVPGAPEIKSLPISRPSEFTIQPAQYVRMQTRPRHHLLSPVTTTTATTSATRSANFQNKHRYGYLVPISFEISIKNTLYVRLRVLKAVLHIGSTTHKRYWEYSIVLCLPISIQPTT